MPGTTTRPITDRVKESLFNIIGADIQGASMLDMFAGTGSVGIEALSRGASYVLFVDLEPQAVATVRTNLLHTGLDGRAEVLRIDAFSLLEQAARREFDYVYVAPPQYKGLWKRALVTLDSHPKWLSPDGWVIVQVYPGEYEQVPLQRLQEFDRRKYGSTLLVFYQPGLA